MVLLLEIGKIPAMAAAEEVVVVDHLVVILVIEDMIRIMVLILDLVVDQDMMIQDLIFNVNGDNLEMDMQPFPI